MLAAQASDKVFNKGIDFDGPPRRTGRGRGESPAAPP
eukprot:CAMPEP_0182854816 /NCGR_PEP_ID=MMETSP0034_2-20130328/1484_1 /TAXON_ID=156128 /ORGANISM="Nephroselmis pyriformis, Strain CCMP717" /LENGTH=36 /DNA_ID= /DNA_START= /DNA_END= /DNA_ORIENTATION=